MRIFASLVATLTLAACASSRPAPAAHTTPTPVDPTPMIDLEPTTASEEPSPAVDSSNTTCAAYPFCDDTAVAAPVEGSQPIAPDEQ